MQRLALVIIGSAAFTFTGGCGDDTGGMPDGSVTCEQTIFEARCSTAGCHDSVTGAGNLDLTNIGNGASLVNQPAATAAQNGLCEGTGMVIDGTNPDMSLMITKLEDTPGCGLRMPQVGNALSASEKTCIQEWVRTAARM